MNPNEEPEPNGDSSLVRLLRLAGPRPQPPQALSERVRAAVHEQWRRDVTHRARQRVFVGLGATALAAGALLVLAPRRPPAEFSPERAAQPVAVVARLEGPSAAWWPSVGSPSESQRLRLQEALQVDTVIETSGAARVALRLSSGPSLRLDSETRLVLTSATVVSLERGAVYVDSGGAPGAAPLEVRTARGVARDVGTQFEVRVIASEIRIRVREGSVRLRVDTGVHDASAGGELTTAGGEVRRGSVPRHGPEWAWVVGVAPIFQLEGASLADFLAWSCRENGWVLRFVRAEDEAAARTIAPHGSLVGLGPAESLDAVLTTAGFRSRLDQGALTLERTQDPS